MVGFNNVRQARGLIFIFNSTRPKQFIDLSPVNRVGGHYHRSLLFLLVVSDKPIHGQNRCDPIQTSLFSVNEKPAYSLMLSAIASVDLNEAASPRPFAAASATQWMAEIAHTLSKTPIFAAVRIE